MARYPGAEREQRIDAGTLLRQVSAIFAACGMPDDDAALLADSLVQADLRGIHSHGVLRVPDYVAKLTGEGVNPRGVPRVARRNAGAIVDGDNSIGQIRTPRRRHGEPPRTGQPGGGNRRPLSPDGHPVERADAAGPPARGNPGWAQAAGPGSATAVPNRPGISRGRGLTLGIRPRYCARPGPASTGIVAPRFEVPGAVIQAGCVEVSD